MHSDTHFRYLRKTPGVSNGVSGAISFGEEGEVEDAKAGRRETHHFVSYYYYYQPGKLRATAYIYTLIIITLELKRRSVPRPLIGGVANPSSNTI